MKNGPLKKTISRITILFAWICGGFALYFLVLTDRYRYGGACFAIGFIPYLVFNQFR
ncbi:MAG TPA: hypothetical protein PLA90_16740 [Candidatus Sumerlaeota bacterium]|nr:hypothetical protein [Candidatus Sumerlaeota bacterium]HPS03190.1 hypothetical protein [Candidatus Sumerlaeota bacterium]